MNKNKKNKKLSIRYLGLLLEFGDEKKLIQLIDEYNNYPIKNLSLRTYLVFRLSDLSENTIKNLMYFLNVRKSKL